MKSIKRVGLLGNPEKANYGAALHQAERFLVKAGRRVFSDLATQRMARLRCPALANPIELAQNCELLMVFGGDGTMLRAARDIEGATTPLMGINVGGLGFLTTVSSKAMVPALERVLAGEFDLDQRPLIQLSGGRDGRLAVFHALNDFVISRMDGSRLIELDVHVNGQELTRYRCDGLIVSSPTGSTAYSLAAGGAIVHPAANVFAITPICPHTLSNRSVILGLNDTIKITSLSAFPRVMVSGDGEKCLDLAPAAAVEITRSRWNVRLVRLHGSTFFDTLRHKLDWSGAHV